MKAVIFDIDGTLSDPSHRTHHVTGGNKNWPAFFDALGDDPCHEPIRWLLDQLRAMGVKIIITTGRPETHRVQTETWLADNSIHYDALYMRAAEDYRQDAIIKSQILDGIIADGFEVMLCVDDRQQVVDMWRERGLTCLQCRPDDGVGYAKNYGQLTLMVGPSGAGKTSFLAEHGARYGIEPSHIISSDQIRQDLCDDWRDQTRNADVFAALHALVRARLMNGLPAVVDATNIRRKDRLAIVALTGDSAPVRYIIIDRPVVEKRRTGGWRNEIQGIDLIGKHDQTFRSNLRDILAGDGRDGIEVIDLRELADAA